MNTNYMREHYQALEHKKETEIRALPSGIKVYVNNEDDFVKTCKRLNKTESVYVGYNERVKNGSKKEHVINCKYVPVDVDGASKEQTVEIEKAFKYYGLKYKYKAETGNGYHYYFPISEKTNNKDIVECLNQSKKIFNALNKIVLKVDVKILDPAVYDPNRILRVWGTHNKKPNRKNFEVKLVEKNENFHENDRYGNEETLEQLYISLEKTTDKKYKHENMSESKVYKKSPDMYLIKHGELIKNPIVTLLRTKLPYGEINNIPWFQLKCLLRDSNYDLNCDEFKRFKSALDTIYEGNFTINIPSKAYNFNPETLNNYCKRVKRKPIYSELIKKELFETIEQAKGILNAKKKIKKIYTIQQIMDMEIPPVEWFIDNMIAKGQLHFFGGKSASYKSWVALALSLSLCSKINLFNHFECKQGKVLYLDEENNLRRQKRRLMQLQKGQYKDVNMDNMLLSSYQNFRLDTLDGFEELKYIIDELKPDMVVFDSLKRFMTGDENDATVGAEIYMTIKQLCLEKEIGVIMIHHLTKSGLGGMDALRGTGDWAAQSDNILLFEKHKNDKHMTKVILEKLRDGPDEGTTFNIQFEDVFEDEEIDPINGINLNYFEQSKENTESKVEQCMNAIINHIEVNCIKTFKSGEMKDEMEVLGYKQKTFYDSLQKLHTTSKISKDKQGVYNVV